MHLVAFLMAVGSIVVTATSCSSSEATKDYGPGTFKLTGTMKQIEVEGGCWQFVSDDGKNYQVMGDKAALLLRDGLRATVVVTDAEEMASICMVGDLVELVEIIVILN